ncbi:MAG: DUF2141 domain-containing protein [Pseudomonadota bacterium]
MVQFGTRVLRRARRGIGLRASTAMIALTMLSTLMGGQAVLAQQSAAPGAQDAALFDFDHVSCRDAANEIRVVIINVKEPVGLMTTDLYNNDPENFLAVEGRALQKKVAARAPTTQFCLYAPTPGDYAIAVYHDENANGSFDKGAFGLPAEPWGLSRDPRVGLRAPPISNTLFTVTPGSVNVKIRLRKR